MKHNHIKRYNHERGAAAIFIVVFFALLLGVIVVSFTKIAIQDQQQATINDLNRSAYDSAEAGLEDAMRVLNNYNNKCVKVAPTPFTQAECDQYKTHLDSANTTPNPANCNLQDMPGISENPATGEVAVKTNDNDDALDQAYTCVKVRTQTPDVKIAGVQDESYLIPLKAVSGATINSVEINWHDAASDANGASATFNTFADLPTNWGNNTPALLRVQAIKVPTSSINIDSINTNASSVFLYPLNSGPFSTINDIFAENAFPGGEKGTAPHRAQCQSSSAQYHCGMTLGGFAGSDNYYLRITPLYNNTSFQIILNPGSNTLFDNVQPEIDSTGRANNVFRRIQQRVQYEAPELENFTISGGFEITDGFCKDFNIAVKESDYISNCTP